MHRIIHRQELHELEIAVRRFGGEVHFGLDYTGHDASGTERPVICVNLSHGEGPEDVYINAIRIHDDCMEILAEHKEYGDPFILDTDDIEFGHVSFITDNIPDNEDKGTPTLMKTATFITVGNQWLCINTEDHTWEYQDDVDDDETYVSGGYETDDDRPCTVTGYDGCFDLPYAVKEALRNLGYALEL